MLPCPDTDLLRQLRNQTLSPEHYGALQEHLGACPHCRAALEELTEADLPPRESTAPPSRVPGYEILGELGRGGMGVVYKARQVKLDRTVALKMILAGAHAAPEELDRFRREAEAVARLQHPNIVQIHEVGELDGCPYFCLEYVEGGSLAQKLAGTPLPPAEAARLVESLARAIHHAHEQGIVHRDLKPANILLAEDVTTKDTKDTKEDKQDRQMAGSSSAFRAIRVFRGSTLLPKVTDFGLAKRLDTGEELTRSGAIVGTPSYMAPEQAAGKSKEIGPAVDVYALGAVLYETLTGRPPFKAATPLDTVLQVLTEEPVPPSRLQPRLPRDLETICLKCLEKNPARRYASARALAEDLHRYLDDRPILARPTGRWEQLRKFARRNKLLVGSTLAVTLALVLGIIGTSLGMARAWQAEGIARTNLSRALEAEKETRRDLARSHWDNARLAAGHGRWREALTMFDKALEAGFEDEIAVRLEKIKALLALHEGKRAEQEMASLSRRPDLGKRQSVLLLYRGDLALGQFSGKEQALADVRRALSQGLPPDEEAYARALLADWPQDAVQHLRRALKLNPAHPDARHLLFPLLLSLGRFEECKEEAHTLLAFFPEDPSPRIFLAVVHLLEGDAGKAASLIRETEAQLGKERVAVLLEIATVFHSALQAAAASDQPQVPPLLLWRLIGLLNKFRQLETRSPVVLDYHAVNLPALARVWQSAYTAITSYAGGRFSDEMMARLDEVVTHHPEGVAYFLHATGNIARASKQKGAAMLPYLRKAELSFRRAMDAPSTLPVFRRQARYWGTYTQALLAKSNPKLGSPDLEMRKLALGNMKRLLADGGLSPTWCANLTEMALTKLEDYDLARLLAAAGARQAPRDLRFVRMRAQIELAAGAYHPALEAANKVLAKLPKDAEALRIRKEAQDKLRELPR